MENVGLLVLIFLIVMSSSSDVITFDDIGIGDIEIPSLGTRTVSAEFRSEETGSVIVEVNIYAEGKLIVEISINNISHKIDGTTSFECRLESTNNLTIKATNYGTSPAIIYGNSTIRIRKQEKNIESESIVPSRIKALYFASILVPPIIIYVLRKKTVVPSSEKPEVIIV